VRVLEITVDGAEDSLPSGLPVEQRVVERGVKVKWPAKRTSVGDMNKRVRGIIDWVGREQAVAVERRRRRDALMKASKDQSREADGLHSNEPHEDEMVEEEAGTMHMMEELMKELIAFQEKFGPSAKGKERERRTGG